ncbi:nucleolar protein 9 [Drosophila kikkawai]|uniref:Nucleolar protein 9 n=1 Tax=Drosophila kikkawai TaxID=30033 RepID=A0A6P4JC00_DROKI|nr:nucleolar protein 9 [Drosophila kikkawai]
MQTEDKAKRKRPKRKGNRFMRNAKGFAKQGIFGRGTHIDDEQFSYFINILDAMKAGFEEVEERVNMANNVFEQTNDQEIHLSSNQIVSKALESLVGFVDDAQLERYFNKFGDNLRPLCSDRFASHVLQKMLEIAFLRGVGKKSVDQEQSDAAKRAKPDAAQVEEEYNLGADFSEDHREKCRQFVLRISKFMLNNLEDFVWDTCASHIMRTAILSLVGMHVPKIAFEKGGAEMAKHRKLYEVPDEWPEVMKEFPQRLEMWPQFADFPYQEHSSALLGVICLALSVADKSMLKHFGKKILTISLLKPNDAEEEKKNGDTDAKIEIKDDDDVEEGSTQPRPDDGDNQDVQAPVLPKVFHHQSSVILLETILGVAGAKLLTQLYAMLFCGRVANLAQQHETNFSVQRLLQHIKEASDFEAVFSELQPQVEGLLKMGYTGVVSALSAACLRLGTKQAQMIAALQSALHVSGGDKEKSKLFFNCLVKLKPSEVVGSDESGFVHLHGSLIAQHILQFNKPIFLVNCILDLSATQLSQVFNTPNGSHIVDAFMQSKYIGEKSRERLIRQLEGFYVDLAITRHGSRVLEQCFQAAQEAQKLRIAKELFSKASMLKGSPYGRLIYTKYRMDTYKLSPSQWQESLSKHLDPDQPKEAKRKTAKSAADAFKDILS